VGSDEVRKQRLIAEINLVKEILLSSFALLQWGKPSYNLFHAFQEILYTLSMPVAKYIICLKDSGA
jgi:hypothetical protein